MIEIDGPLWFVGALLICGAHVRYLRSWRRDQRQSLAWWHKYDADAQKRHDEFMAAIRRDNVGTFGWDLSSNKERGQT